MDKFKIGGKVTINENEKYMIVDIVKKDDKEYYLACTYKKPITPIVFQRIDENGETYIKIEDDAKIIKEICKKIIKE